jgi:hypothetical protein
MDFCHHPSVRRRVRSSSTVHPKTTSSYLQQILKKHGMPLEVKNAKSQPKPHTMILPIFSPSRTALHADIPITPVGKDGRRDDVGDDPAWKSKSGKLYWVCSLVVFQSSSILIVTRDPSPARFGDRHHAQQERRGQMDGFASRAFAFARQQPDIPQATSLDADRKFGSSRDPEHQRDHPERVLHGRSAEQRTLAM